MIDRFSTVILSTATPATHCQIIRSVNKRYDQKTHNFLTCE
jgi:hypothetical protein